MKKILALILASVVMLTACQNTEELVDSSAKDTPMESSNPHRVTLEKALRTADVLLGQISEQPSTRVSRTVKSVDVMTNKLTRATNDIDTAVYLVNYNGGGFALLGADDRLPSLFAISEEGTLEWSDFEENEGLALYMDYMTKAIASAPDFDPYEESESTAITIPVDPEPAYPYLFEKCSSRINYNVKKWGQNDPFNSYCPYWYTDRYGHDCNRYVGCLPLACAIYMSYYKYPKTITIQQLGTINLDWMSMIEDKYNETLHLFLAILGEPQYLAHYYLPDSIETYAHEEYTYRTFNALGYKTPHGEESDNFFIPFDQNQILEWLGMTYKYVGYGYFTPKAGGPVLIVGERYTDSKNTERSMHAWVIDGYIKNKLRATTGFIGDYETLLHCVWGWDGRYNGYFNWEIENGFRKPIMHDDDDDNQPDTLFDKYYNLDLRIQGGVVPKNN